MSVRIQHGGEGPLAQIQRPEKIARQEEARIRLDDHLLQHITIHFAPVCDLRVQRRLGRQGLQAAAHQDVHADGFGFALPVRPRLHLGERAQGVQRLGHVITLILLSQLRGACSDAEQSAGREYNQPAKRG
jgi:hypothetical protein